MESVAKKITELTSTIESINLRREELFDECTDYRNKFQEFIGYAIDMLPAGANSNVYSLSAGITQKGKALSNVKDDYIINPKGKGRNLKKGVYVLEIIEENSEKTTKRKKIEPLTMIDETVNFENALEVIGRNLTKTLREHGIEILEKYLKI